MNTTLQKYGLYGLYGACFFSVLSSSMLAISSILMLVFWIASGSYKNITTVVTKNPTCLVAVIYFLLMAIGISYSSGPLAEAVDYCKGYQILLYIPIVLSLAGGDEKVTERIVLAFFAGYLVLLLNAYLVHFDVIAQNKLSFHRRGAGFLTIFLFLALQKMVTRGKYWWLWSLMFLLIGFDLFYIVKTRTGWLIILALTALTFIQYFSWKKCLVLALLSLIALFGIYKTSPLVRQHVAISITNFEKYKTTRGESKTSIGVRLDWYQNALELIREKPLFGYGTGSFGTEQARLIEGKKTMASPDPHNEFLLTWVQIGAGGLLLFLLLLTIPLYQSYLLIKGGKKKRGFAIQGVVVYLFIGSLLNSWLQASVPSHIFALLLAAYFIGQKETDPLSVTH